jgi:nitroimidazol reductase NimA-like FMN-containing flavoprotein (pyridoxamine 5'-phosphate oxidase superfamily)
MADHPQMTPEEREALLGEPHIAVLATESGSGRPHLAPLWYRWADGAFTLATPTGSMKHRNLQARPRFTLCIDKRSWPYRSLIAECDVVAQAAQQGYPEEIAARYLDGDRLAGLLDRYRAIEWQVVRGRPTRWYGHINRGG